jgi:hypothetical protein
VREIRFYQHRSGGSPVEAFLNSLSAKQAQKVVWALRLVQEMPLQELALAEERRRDDLSREGEDE